MSRLDSALCLYEVTSSKDLPPSNTYTLSSFVYSPALTQALEGGLGRDMPLGAKSGMDYQAPERHKTELPSCEPFDSQNLLLHSELRTELEYFLASSIGVVRW
jgi:hypothetical protein